MVDGAMANKAYTLTFIFVSLPTNIFAANLSLAFRGKTLTFILKSFSKNVVT
jgi:hypothetical protein